MDDFITNIQCDIELNSQGADLETALARLTAALQKTTAAIAAGEYGDGFHDIFGDNGKKLGTVYFDYSEGDGFSDPEAPHH